MDIKSRQWWGARRPKSTPTNAHQSSVTFHWEGPHMGGYQPDDTPGIVRGIQAFHMDVRGWNDIAYNYLVDRYGLILEGRGRNIYNAASGTTEANTTSAAVCYIGGVDDPFTDEAKRSMRELALDLGGDTHGHRDWVGTECPGTEIYQWAHGGMPVVGGGTPPPPVEPDTTPCELKVFARGDNDRCVFYIQRLLNRRGFGLVDDGDFGPATERAVKVFQTNHHLSADGIVGKATWAALWWGQTL